MFLVSPPFHFPNFFTQTSLEIIGVGNENKDYKYFKNKIGKQPANTLNNTTLVIFM